MGAKGEVSCGLSAQGITSYIVPAHAVDTIYDVVANRGEHVGTKFHPYTPQVRLHPVYHAINAVAALIPAYRPS